MVEDLVRAFDPKSSIVFEVANGRAFGEYLYGFYDPTPESLPFFYDGIVGDDAKL